MSGSFPFHHVTCESSGVGAQIPFNAVCEAGAYVANWSGHLIRMPEGAAKPGRTPLVNMLGSRPLILTKISDDPFVPISDARTVAANLGAPVDF